MECPMCGCEEIEKAIFNNGHLGKHKKITAIGFYCNNCNHSALVLVPIDSVKMQLEAETIASAKFQMWEVYA